jgi:hypothetical protein
VEIEGNLIMAEAKKTDAPAKEAERKSDESKSDAFKRLGSKRMNRTLGDLKGLEKLANTSAYEYTPEQVAKLTGALDAAVKRIKDAFAGVKAVTGGFDL